MSSKEASDGPSSPPQPTTTPTTVTSSNILTKMQNNKKILIGVSSACLLILVITVTIATANRCPALLISGGIGVSTTEMFFPEPGCVKEMSSDDERSERSEHSLDSDRSKSTALSCGGNGDGNQTRSCQIWDGSVWRQAKVKLMHERMDHVSWPRDDGVLLMGGERSSSSKSTELVTWDGKSSKSSFNLTYRTANSCGIPDPDTDSIVITGGEYSMTKVIRYDRNGREEVLDDLNTGRRSHGCTQFIDGDGVQVLLVTGGYDAQFYDLSSTEILRMDSAYNEWTEAGNGNLPHKLQGLRGATLGNVVYMTGGLDNGDVQSLILSYDMNSKSWMNVANMTTPRYKHAVTVWG